MCSSYFLLGCAILKMHSGVCGIPLMAVKLTERLICVFALMDANTPRIFYPVNVMVRERPIEAQGYDTLVNSWLLNRLHHCFVIFVSDFCDADPASLPRINVCFVSQREILGKQKS